MDDGHPANSLANNCLFKTMESSNTLCNEVLSLAQAALIDAIPQSRKVITQIIEGFRDPLKQSALFFNNNTGAQTRLPISVRVREGAKERRKGVFATNVRGVVGAVNLELAVRNDNLVPDEQVLVEVRVFEPDLDEYCTVPVSELPFVEIKSGLKYELVFENDFKSRSLKVPVLPSISHTSQSQVKLEEVLNNAAVSSSSASTSNGNNNNNTSSTSAASSSSGGAGVRRAASHIGSVSKSAATIRELEAHKELPVFNILDVIRADSRGQMITEALVSGGVKKNVRLRVFFVQILGRYFNEVVRPQLVVANAATRRAFIDECFNQLAEMSDCLPNVEEYSNRMGNGYMDIYLKHQVTRERKRAAQKRQADETLDQLNQYISSDLAQHLIHSGFGGLDQFDEEESAGLVDPDSEEAQQLKRFNFTHSPSLEFLDADSAERSKESSVKIEQSFDSCADLRPRVD